MWCGEQVVTADNSNLYFTHTLNYNTQLRPPLPRAPRRTQRDITAYQLHGEVKFYF